MKKNLLFLFCFFTLGLTAQVPSYIPTNGLVGWWPFNGNANDESGNGNNGTVNGATLTTDRFGVANKAYSFNGSSNFIKITNSSIAAFGLQSFSSSAWIKTNSTATINNAGMFVRYDNCVSNSGWGLGFTGFYKIGGLEFPASRSGNSITTTNAYNNNQWHLAVFIRNVTLKIDYIYIDGVLQGQIGFSTINDLLNTGSDLRFGSCAGFQYHSGILDDITIYNRVLTQQEITALYQGCTTPTATITPQSNTNFCQGNNVVLNATTGNNYTYEWYKNSSLISGVTTNSYAATTAGNYTVKVIDGSCNATSSATTLTLIDTVTWTGIVDNDWHKPCNWSPEVVPECCNSVKIPFTPISPVVSGVGKAKNVTLYSTSGATLTVNNGANLQIETCPVNKTENICPSLPVLTTTVISSVTQTTAVSGGNITYTGASSITTKGVCWSTTTAPTIANSKTTDGTGIGSYSTNLSGLIAATTYYVRAYATNSSGTSYGNEVSFTTQQPAYALGSVFCNGTPTFVQDVTNPITGKTWMDRNLGATQVASNETDNLSFGDIYQWGRGNDGHQCRASVTTNILSSSDQPGHGNYIIVTNNPKDWRSLQNINLWQGVNGVNNPCPSGYRIPTDTELNAEKLSFTNQNSSGAFSSPLKLTLGGFRSHNTGIMNNVGSSGDYWSSTISSTYSRGLEFTTGSATMYIFSNGRALGFSIRCIKN